MDFIPLRSSPTRRERGVCPIFFLSSVSKKPTAGLQNSFLCAANLSLLRAFVLLSITRGAQLSTAAAMRNTKGLYPIATKDSNIALLRSRGAILSHPTGV